MAIRLTTDQFIERSQSMHGDRYDYAQSVYVNAKTKVKFNCAIHGMFLQTPNVHLAGQGCPSCSFDKKRCTIQEFIEKARQVHGDIYNYSESIYLTTHTKLTIVCPMHGTFNQQPSNHLSGQGCPVCSDTKLTINQFVKEAQAIHKYVYDYSHVDYTMTRNKVDILCFFHGIFKQTPNSHLRGSGCPKCNNIRKRTTLSEFIKISNIVHHDMYDYSHVDYTTTHDKVKIICRTHGFFLQAPVKHMTGLGCTQCGATVSNAELRWLEYHDIPETTVNRQVRLQIGRSKYTVDGFDATTNTVYEFWGDFWHGHPTRYNPSDINPVNHKTFGELYEKTMVKRQTILDAGYNLVEIWESDWCEFNKNKL
jgi:protein-arginine kinase activator protein McsA